MSVLLNFSIFPLGEGTSVSKYVSEVLDMVRASGVAYKLNPMGTSIETETMHEALSIVQRAHDILEPNADRIYSAITIDSQKGKSNRIETKTASVEARIGKLNK